MCIAVIKPKNVEFPTKKELSNCFTSNPHGAGFMYSDGNNLIIKKGYMTFDSFYKAFQNEKIDKSKLVFFHFRIATHGLIDGGNTHPFPVVNDVSLLRKVDLKFKGYGLIHNGVIYYPKTAFASYDPSGIISDTMLMAMRLADAFSNNTKKIEDFETAIAYNFTKRFDKLDKAIENELSYNKVAIMNEKEDYVKYGDWIEHNGSFYSNNDFEDQRYYSSYGYGGYYNNYNDDAPYCCACDNCNVILPENELYETEAGFFCEDCIAQYETFTCQNCHMICFTENNETNTICDRCLDEYNNDNDYSEEYDRFNSHKNQCDYCGDTNVATTLVDREHLCSSCLKTYYKKCPICNRYVSIIYPKCNNCGTIVEDNYDSKKVKCLDCGELVNKEDLAQDNICKKCWSAITEMANNIANGT